MKVDQAIGHDLEFWKLEKNPQSEAGEEEQRGGEEPYSQEEA
jgi:hypothetical protein